jgi:hypothetical protein
MEDFLWQQAEALVCGMAGVPALAAMRWWTSPGPLASDQRTQEGTVALRSVAKSGGERWSMSGSGALPVPPGWGVPFRNRSALSWVGGMTHVSFGF